MTNEQEKEFFERFGANKIWVTPSKDNVETILEIHSFILKVVEEAREKGQREVAKLVIGWREIDWPEGFDRKTAQMIADDLEARIIKTNQN